MFVLEFLPQGFAVLVGPLWHDNLENHIQVAAPGLGRQSVALHAQTLSGLASRFDAEIDLAIQSGHIDLGAQRRFPGCDRQCQVQVVANGVEIGVRNQPDSQVQVTRGSLAIAGPTLALEADTLTVGNALGNLYLQRLL